MIAAEKKRLERSYIFNMDLWEDSLEEAVEEGDLDPFSFADEALRLEISAGCAAQKDQEVIEAILAASEKYKSEGVSEKTIEKMRQEGAQAFSGKDQEDGFLSEGDKSTIKTVYTEAIAEWRRVFLLEAGTSSLEEAAEVARDGINQKLKQGSFGPRKKIMDSIADAFQDIFQEPETRKLSNSDFVKKVRYLGAKKLDAALHQEKEPQRHIEAFISQGSVKDIQYG